MKLASLLDSLEYELIQGTEEIEIVKLAKHSKEVVAGALFVCMTGALADGCIYADEAIQNGAVAVVTEKKIKVPQEVTLVRVKDARKALAELSAAFYCYPARELKLIGVTGTKGKTTTACMIRDVLELAGYKTGLIGTIEIQTGRRSIPAEHTSPESLELQKYLREMADSGCEIAVIEVSSQGLKLSRVEGIFFEAAVFTNLGRDHIGKYEHADFEEYKRCKAKLFRQCRVGIANIDDRYWKELFDGSDCELRTVGSASGADYRISDEKFVTVDGKLGITYRIDGAVCGKVRVSMPGKFNVYNSALAAVVCRQFGVPMDIINRGMEAVRVRGRVEHVPVSARFTVMIDYAHNAMSLQSILEMLHSYHQERIVCVFGCGGNRARERRPEMGRVAGELADLTIITSDNPRYEEPLAIMEEIESGIRRTSGKYLKICDRKEAIQYAISHARDGEVILIAGKGHENYQEIRGVKYHMDDRELIYEAAGGEG